MRVPFSKRMFLSVREFAGELGALVAKPRQTAAMMLGFPITPRVREALMLVVTGVNDCRYCRAVHRPLGRVTGLNSEQVAGALAGDFRAFSSELLPALKFAREWAKRNGVCTPAEWAEMIHHYGLPKSEIIMQVLRTIRFCNLSGNTVDGLINEVSRGRFA